MLLQKKVYLLMMNDGDSIIKHLHGFNIMVGQLGSVDIKTFEKDKCITMLFSLLNSCDALVGATGSDYSIYNKV